VVIGVAFLTVAMDFGAIIVAIALFNWCRFRHWSFAVRRGRQLRKSRKRNR